MKKILLFLCAALLLFPACKREIAVNGALSDTVLRIQNAIESEEAFVLADTDFTADNLGYPPYLEEAQVCFGTGEKTREFGIFRLTDRSKAAEFKQSVESYLKTEREALHALSDLYPAEELEERLSLYDNATVGSEGMLVYYFVLDKKETQKALEALTGR